MTHTHCEPDHAVGLSFFCEGGDKRVKTIETIVTAEMVAIDNRPRRRIGLKGLNGLNLHRVMLSGAERSRNICGYYLRFFDFTSFRSE